MDDSPRSKPETFLVQDLWLAASLISQGLRLVKVDVSSRRRLAGGDVWAHFHLEDSADRPQLVQAYYAGTLSCPIGPLRTALNLCRDKIRSATSGANRKEA